MKIMTFVDLENFKHSLWASDSSREPKYDSLYLLCDNITKKLGWEKYNPRHIRTYVYTGEYTENLISYIKYLQGKLIKDWQQKKLKESLDTALRRRKAQQNLLNFMDNCNFFEIKTTPLKFNIHLPNPFIQKGVDVLIATDLLSHAFRDSFDVAIICSGDLDLIESIKLTKNLGKKVIIVSHKGKDDSGISKNIIKVSDCFVNLSDFSDEELNQISEIVEHKKGTKQKMRERSKDYPALIDPPA